MRADNDAAQRFYRRLGATLRTKVIAAWRPHDHADNPAHQGRHPLGPVTAANLTWDSTQGANTDAVT